MPNGTTTSAMSSYNYVALHNKLLGGIRFRQLRVKEESCVRANTTLWKCYPEWSESDQSKDTIAGIEFKTDVELKEEFWWYGDISSYPGSGFAVDLPLNKTAALQTLATLKRNNFLDQQTRFVAFDFSCYNPSLNLHTVTRVAFETPGTGRSIICFLQCVLIFVYELHNIYLFYL